MIDYTKFEGHTPGPWKAHGNGGSIMGINGPIAQVKVTGQPKMDGSDLEGYANKNIIAAAPDLLEACKRKDILLCKMYREHLVYGAVDPVTYDEIREELDREEI